jgi:hypothetical protein
LQYKDSLSATTWQDALPDVTATGLTTTATNALGGAMQRYYRVELAPTAPPPLAITSIRVTNGLAVITWNSVAGQIYRLQYKDSLSATNWQDALPDVTATGPTTTATNALGGATHRFYRVILVQPGTIRPIITSIRLANGIATITWTSVSGQAYRLQYKASLSDANWIDVAPDVTATGVTTTLTNAVGNSVQRFYRVALVP